jgi:hypothetical protein
LRLFLIAIIGFVLVACWVFFYPQDDLTSPVPNKVAIGPSKIEQPVVEEATTSVGDSYDPDEDRKFTPPELEEVGLGSEVIFQLPTGSVHQGVVDSIEFKGQTTTIVQGDIAAGGFFVFSYGPSATFGSVTTQDGSFEYLGNSEKSVFRRPPMGKLINDVRYSETSRGEELDR